MTTDMARFEVESRIHVALLKSRGDVMQAAKLTGYPAAYVYRMARKLKEKRKRDVSVWVADSIMETILVGYEQRLAYLQRCLQLLEGKEEAYVSVCCNDPVQLVQPRRTRYWECVKCGKKAGVELQTRGGVFNLILSTIAALREEDSSLVEFADKMGFTNRVPTPIQDNRQNLFVFTNGKATIDATLAKQIEEKTPLEREKIRKELTGTLLKMASEVAPKEVKK